MEYHGLYNVIYTFNMAMFTNDKESTFFFASLIERFNHQTWWFNFKHYEVDLFLKIVDFMTNKGGL